MRSGPSICASALLTLSLWGASESAQALGTQRILTAAELTAPVFVAAPTGDDRLFVLERAGEIWIYQNGALLGTPFLSIDGVDTSGEGGLLGLAFPADYATKRACFTSITHPRV